MAQEKVGAVIDVEYKAIDRLPLLRFGSDGSVWKMNEHGAWVVFESRMKSRRTVRDNGKQVYIARLLLEAFVGPPPSKYHVARHLDDDHRNNNISNLAWGTPSENMEDASRNGRLRSGPRALPGHETFVVKDVPCDVTLEFRAAASRAGLTVTEWVMDRLTKCSLNDPFA